MLSTKWPVGQWHRGETVDQGALLTRYRSSFSEAEQRIPVEILRSAQHDRATHALLP